MQITSNESMLCLFEDARFSKENSTTLNQVSEVSQKVQTRFCFFIRCLIACKYGVEVVGMQSEVSYSAPTGTEKNMFVSDKS